MIAVFGVMVILIMQMIKIVTTIVAVIVQAGSNDCYAYGDGDFGSTDDRS